MRGIEGDRGRFIRGTRYHSEVIQIIKVHSEVVQERASQQQSSIRWHSSHMGAERGTAARQSDAIRRNQQQSAIRATWALKEGRRTHSTSPWAAASVTGAARQILAPSAQPASGGAARPPASRQRASASKAALASPRASPPPPTHETEEWGLPPRFEWVACLGGWVSSVVGSVSAVMANASQASLHTHSKRRARGSRRSTRGGSAAT